MERLLSVPFIGMRTIKTVVAVILSALIMENVFHQTPFFACIGAVVAVERTMSMSVKAGFVRNIGTISGGLVGIVFSTLTQNIVLLSLGIIPLVYLESLIARKDSILSGFIVYFGVVFLNIGTGSSGAMHYGLIRILCTLFGTVVGIVVNYFVFPPKSDELHINYGVKS